MERLTCMDEDWDKLITFLPDNWQELAVSTNATKGLRQDKDIENFLHVLLMHVGCGYSMRETAVRAEASGLAHLSDVGILKRLRKAEAWLHALCRELFKERQIASLRECEGETIRLIDASVISEPGKTGSFWRIHYSLSLPSLQCDFFELTPCSGKGVGESLCRYEAQEGDHFVADRGYCTARGFHAIREQGAHLTVRLNPQNVRISDPQGNEIDLMTQLAAITENQFLDIPVHITGHNGGYATEGRICALRKGEVAISNSQEKLRQRAVRRGEQLTEQTLFYAQYVIVFTTTPQSRYNSSEILELYRIRWQIELVFKRFKQQAQLGHLPKYDPVSSRAWLYGKLLVVLLTEKLLDYAERFSPWGYRQPKEPNLQPVEGI